MPFSAAQHRPLPFLNTRKKRWKNTSSMKVPATGPGARWLSAADHWAFLLGAPSMGGG